MAPERATVVVIEDEADLRTLVRESLARAGYAVIEAADGRAGIRALHEHRPDAIVLDVGLPGLDGFEVLERIRDASDVPVLMLTARSDEMDKVRGLGGGADDYLTKPFGRPELVARLHALLRRAAASAPARAEFDDGLLKVDFEARTVEAPGGLVALTPLEFRLVVAFVTAPGRVLSHDQLLEQAWDDPAGIGADRVKFAIMRLRRKLEAAGVERSPIEAIRGFGYRYGPSGAGAGAGQRSVPPGAATE